MNMKKKKWSTDHMNFEALLQNITLHKVHHILFAQVYIFFLHILENKNLFQILGQTEGAY